MSLRVLRCPLNESINPWVEIGCQVCFGMGANCRSFCGGRCRTGDAEVGDSPLVQREMPRLDS